MNFGAVILAGGRSSRMGRDKAFLEVGGEPLLARQIRVAREAGAVEVLVSGRRGVDYSRFGCPVVWDQMQDSGPVSGILAGLEAANSPLVLVLAVDLPQMSAGFLRRLLAYCAPSSGAIPCVVGKLEPLAAFYPMSARLVDPFAAIARRQLKRDGAVPSGPSAKGFADACRQQGLAGFVDFPATEAHFFTNWNSPSECCAGIGS